MKDIKELLTSEDATNISHTIGVLSAQLAQQWRQHRVTVAVPEGLRKILDEYMVATERLQSLGLQILMDQMKSQQLEDAKNEKPVARTFKLNGVSTIWAKDVLYFEELVELAGLSAGMLPTITVHRPDLPPLGLLPNQGIVLDEGYNISVDITTH